ncbi:mevalonate kinase [Secundilactobacillus oryzae JCM 18671]|uniref:Mevalonate kinase n=1 Tax=Secundilactobacillus oryzae JCM 18671 TaxID=1291743 RepID=A0A081BIL5_9LACO|nr:mevalonate kinase [Secundilactobacillus oryzae]GAK47883.1 mevalonate kinase [Secundilactobacillus oryzae JCM 18671]
MTNISTGTSHAKIILIGEHSVVYNQPAIALPLPAVEAKVTITSRYDGRQFINSDFFSGSLAALPGSMNGNRRLIHALLNRFNAQTAGFEMTIKSDVPAERGMGSSAATAVAIVRAMYHFFGATISADVLTQSANIAESITHGNPSGIDVATTTATNPVWFVHNQGSTELNLNLSGALVIADTGIHGRTSEAVQSVANKLATQQLETRAMIDQLGDLAAFTRIAIEEDNLLSLGDSMTEAQRILTHLQVSHPHIDHLVDVALANGALGAKLTGGGLGGCVIALTDTVSAAKDLQSVLLNSGATNTWVQPFTKTEELIK